MRTIEHLVVHCSATGPDLDIGRAEIDAWHRQRGFNEIGYHFIIRRDGARELGRPIEQIGAHAQGYNGKSIGICLVGGINNKARAANNFTREQFAELGSLLGELREKFPAAKILGHRDLPNVRKDCPSFDVRGWCAQHGIDAL